MIFLSFDSPAILIDGNRDYHIPQIKGTDPKQVFKFVAPVDCCHDQHCIRDVAKQDFASTTSGKFYPNQHSQCAPFRKNTATGDDKYKYN